MIQPKAKNKIKKNQCTKSSNSHLKDEYKRLVDEGFIQNNFLFFSLLHFTFYIFSMKKSLHRFKPL